MPGSPPLSLVLPSLWKQITVLTFFLSFGCWFVKQSLFNDLLVTINFKRI